MERRPNVIIGKVIGNLHSTINHPFYDSKKILVVERMETNGKPASGYLVALDRVGAGPGETVLILDEGNGALAASAALAGHQCIALGIRSSSSWLSSTFSASRCLVAFLP